MDIPYIKSVVQKILDKTFVDSRRKKVVGYSDRLNVCCPVCGDSHKNPNAKRGNLYLNKLLYICFNCDYKAPFDRFVKKFDEQLDPDKKLEIINHLSKNVEVSDWSENIYKLDFSELIDLSDLQRFFNIERGHEHIHDFTPVKPKSGVYKYLIGRGITPEMMGNIWMAKFAKGSEAFEWIICLLNKRGDKVIGMQIRNLKEGRRRLFNIYNWETLKSWVDPEYDSDDISKITIFNKLSYYFNILNIDIEKRVTVFEGYIDSLFYPNSIGCVGVNTDMEFLEKNLDIQYFFDNDITGFIKSSEKIKSGFKVFLWKKMFIDISNLKKDPYKSLNKISVVKDLNKLAQIIPNPYESLNLNKYFSVDKYDLYSIPIKSIV